MTTLNTPALRSEVRAAYGFVERNFNIVKRFWAWEVAWLAYCLANTLAITFIGAGAQTITGATIDTERFVIFLLTGTLVWHYLSMIFNLIGEMIQWERWFGTIEYTLMAPIHRFTHLVGASLFSLVYGLVFTSVILLVVTLFFDLDLSKANLLGGLCVLAAASAPLVGLGLCAAVLPLLSPERGIQMVFVAQSLLLLVSGVYYPVEVLPGWLEALSYLSPATYAIEGMRSALLEGAALAELWRPIVILIGMGVLMLPMGVLVFSGAERWAKRTGRLKREG